jgi:predicted metal-dependent hydrolase
MKREIEINNKKVEYTYNINPRARKLRLSIHCDGNFVVTAPRYIDENIVLQFIIRKSKWIIDKLEYFKNNPRIVGIKSSKKDYLEYKNKALELAQKRIEYFNGIYGFKFNNISIKNQKTRWGSCSRKGNLNFNYKIALISEEFSDYVIVHEICHLKEFNHSQKFWNLVAKTIPNYLEIRKKLRKN